MKGIAEKSEAALNSAKRWAYLFACCLDEASDVGEAMLSANLAHEIAEGKSLAVSQNDLPDFDIHLAHDIFNTRAQAVLNKAMQAARKISARAKRDLERALDQEDAVERSRQVIEFIQRYRVKLAELLTNAQLASLLEGAREVTRELTAVPVFPHVNIPPTLEPADVLEALDEIRGLPPVQREEAIYAKPIEQQEFLRQAIVTEGQVPLIPPPPFRPRPVSEEEEELHFPIIEEAARELSEKNVVNRATFDRLEAAARQKAFTIAGVDAQETLTKVRDALAKNVTEGADFQTFKKDVLAEVDSGTFLSDGHLENVFRTNVQTAFSDGQMNVLNHQFVRSAFPYVRYDAIHDDRVREQHLALEKYGINGTNIYRTNDPVIQTFRPPWEWMCRCSWTPITLRMAAEKGIVEASEWLRTGIEPTPPAFVHMPPFQPPPTFRRSLNAAPLAIALSFESAELFHVELPAKLPEVEKPPVDLSQLFFCVHRDGYDEFYRKPDKLIPLPDIRQSTDYSCGACDAEACGKLRGVGPDTEKEWMEALHTTYAESTDPERIRQYFAELGVEVQLRENMTLDDLRIAWSEGNPVICMVREYDTGGETKANKKYGHYLTVIGIDMGYVFVFDSSADNVLENEDSANAPGLNMVTEAEFLERWHDREYHRLGIVVGKQS